MQHPLALTAALSLGLGVCGGDDPDRTATAEDEMTEDEMTEGDLGDDMGEDDG